MEGEIRYWLEMCPCQARFGPACAWRQYAEVTADFESVATLCAVVVAITLVGPWHRAALAHRGLRSRLPCWCGLLTTLLSRSEFKGLLLEALPVRCSRLRLPEEVRTL